MRISSKDIRRRTFDPVSILHAALGDEDWDDVLKAYSEHIGAVVFLSYPGEDKSCGTEVRTYRYDMNVFNEGILNYQDQWNPEVNPFIRPVFASRPCVGIDRREIISDYDGERNTFFRQAALSQNVFHSRYANLASEEGGVAGIWVGQTKSHGSIEGDQCIGFDQSLQHFSAALRMRGMIVQRDDALRNFHNSIDRLHHGFIAVDSDMKIVTKNTAAATILKSCDGISERNSVLKLKYSNDQADVEAQLRRIASGDLYAHYHGISVRRPSRLPDYRLTIAPSEGLQTGLGAPKGIAIMTLNDPMNPKEPLEAERLADFHGISLAEARVTRLSALGLTKRQIGDELGISENTVRTQLAAARDKLGANNLTRLSFLIG